MENPTTEELIAAAVLDLATRADVAPDSIVVLGVEEVTWRNGSCGCAQPGYSYIQALTPGLRIRLLAADEEYAYHSGRGRPAFWCPAPTE